jgi:antitoxin FitA
MTMPVNLSVKGVPDAVVERLRACARANHRSLQGEMMAMIEAHVGHRPFPARQLWNAARAAGLAGPDEAVQMVRDDRDSR